MTAQLLRYQHKQKNKLWKRKFWSSGNFFLGSVLPPNMYKNGGKEVRVVMQSVTLKSSLVSTDGLMVLLWALCKKVHTITVALSIRAFCLYKP